MDPLKAFLFLLLPVLFLSACNPNRELIPDMEKYLEETEQWKHERLARLKTEKGWLNLAGLFWLEEGANSFGSDPSNDIVFPEKAAAFCGTLTLDRGTVSLQVNNGVRITSGDTAVSKMALDNDHGKNTTRLDQGDLRWYIIKRGEKYGIRLRDLKHPRIGELDHIPSYPPDPDYVVEATLHPFDSAITMTVQTPVEGFTESYQCPGELHFRIRGEKLSLRPFASGKGYFLVFADETTGMETYGAGRFMYCMPDSAGRIILDFNRAYNPPCAFSPFATCPMPPLDNFLPTPIKAGEMAVHFE